MEKTCKLFVFGTLKIGGHFAKRFDHLRIDSRPASTQGKMFSVHGSYPAVDFFAEGQISGEIHEYKNPEEVISEMDLIEGYREGNPNNLYNRIKIAIPTKNGKEEEVYTYSFNRDTSGLKPVESGEWII